jgi:hypothetical protein
MNLTKNHMILAGIAVVILLFIIVMMMRSSNSNASVSTLSQVEAISTNGKGVYNLAIDNAIYGGSGALRLDRIHLNPIASSPTVQLNNQTNIISVGETGLYRISYMIGGSDNTNATRVNLVTQNDAPPSTPNPRDFNPGNYYIWLRVINGAEDKILREFPSVIGTSFNGSGISFVTSLEAGQKLVLVSRSSVRWEANIPDFADKLMLSVERV